MEFDSKNSSILIKKVDQDDVRRSVKYHPSVWGDYFLAYVSTEVSTTEEEELRRQKEMVRKVFAQTPDHSYQKLELIDAIQRLGVGYHFEEEIDRSLQYIHDTYLEYSTKDDDLRTVAVRFRLLRQQGYPVSCDVFTKFIDGEGNFNVSLIKNVEGMLELFEAAQFRIDGEEILEKALEFSSSNLESLLPNMSSSLSKQVKEALKIPIRKSSNREISAIEEEELRRQKEMVRKVLAQTPDHSYHKLELIDATQRLGVGYQFEEEINKSLQYIHDTYLEYSSKDNDLRIVALRFRLLREQGCPVSCDVFNKFIDGEGNFKLSLIKNIKGMLELFEAAQFRMAEEEILEKALEFSSSNLESLLPNMSSSLSKQVKEALKIPILKSSSRVGAKKFISIYQQDESHNEILFNFAKLDFNIIQKMHQKELSDITRWWKDLDFANRLPFARDRVVECYFWALGVYFEPHYHIARRMLTKIINLTSILDDIYDVYGTLDDLQVFTDFFQRWDVNNLEQLPSYMRICFEALSDVYIEMENELEKIGELYRIQYAKEEMQKLVRAYLEEAKWSYNKYTLTMEEYMKVALVSGAYMMLSTTSLVGMGNLVTKKDFDCITSEPLLVLTSTTICRLTNDLVGYGFEKKPTAVECYMNENGASKEEAFAELEKQVMNGWKDMNQEWLRPTVPVSMPVLTRVLNFTRIAHLFYVEEDEYTNSQANIKDIIHDVLVEPVVTD
ncbi:UNVERIFIED_CONTAM: Germacrene-D synthase [Sesamum radiatum]|uniref:Germacrene-D synthase n=1 Tax=Sesamum radiatum TaxID=300843 RepID=A0AAW2JJA4_SESRA